MPPLTTQSTASHQRPPRRFVASLVLAASGPRVAPTRVRLWSPGINPWDGEPQINLTRRAAERVIAEFNLRGNPLSMDIDHAQSLAERKAAKEGADSTPEQTPGAGYCVLELVETPEGPAVDFLPRWSDCGREAAVPEVICCAKHQIETGQRCEFSPDWLGDEQTGEPIRVNRISLVQDGAMHGIGLLASRQLAGRSTAMADPMGECRAAYAYHARMASAGGDNAKQHEAFASELKAHAAGLGIDLDKAEEAPAEAPKVEEKPKEAAEEKPEAPPAPKGPEDQLQKPAMAAAPAALASKAAAAPLTMAAVLQRLGEEKQLDQLLLANKDRIPEKHLSMLASRGLPAAREYVEGLPLRPAPTGTGGDTAGATGGKVRPWKAPLDAAGQFMANRIRVALGKTEAQEAEFDKRIDDDGGITISMVELVERHAAARAKSRSVA